MDRHTPEQRSRNMAAVKSRDTKPELAIRKLLFSLGYRFRLQRRDLPGRPDIVLPKYKLAIFVNGCFWHRHEGCKIATEPKSNTDFWQAKFKSNVARDQRNYAALREMGWQVLVIWECEVKAMVKTRCIPGLPPREQQAVVTAAPHAPLPYPSQEEEVLLAADETAE